MVQSCLGAAGESNIVKASSKKLLKKIQMTKTWKLNLLKILKMRKPQLAVELGAERFAAVKKMQSTVKLKNSLQSLSLGKAILERIR